MRKKASHEGVFRALAEAAAERIVVHLTANLDGLTTAFVVRDFGGRWAPFHGACDLGAIHGDVRDILTARRGLLHFPVHGEIGLYVSSRTRDRLITAYHHPLESEEIGPWSSTLIEGSAGGLQEIERRLPCSRLALQLFRSLLVGRAVALDEHEALGPYPTADLLVIGYGAEDRGARAGNPFERTIAELVEQGHGCPSRWRALVYRPESVQRVVRWFEQHRFAVIGYDDGDLPWAVRDLVASARPTERITAVPPPRNWPVTGQR
jgi:hypothetical protein